MSRILYKLTYNLPPIADAAKADMDDKPIDAMTPTGPSPDVKEAIAAATTATVVPFFQLT